MLATILNNDKAVETTNVKKFEMNNNKMKNKLYICSARLIITE